MVGVLPGAPPVVGRLVGVELAELLRHPLPGGFDPLDLRLHGAVDFLGEDAGIGRQRRRRRDLSRSTLTIHGSAEARAKRRAARSRCPPSRSPPARWPPGSGAARGCARARVRPAAGRRRRGARGRRRCGRWSVGRIGRRRLAGERVVVAGAALGVAQHVVGFLQAQERLVRRALRQVGVELLGAARDRPPESPRRRRCAKRRAPRSDWDGRRACPAAPYSPQYLGAKGRSAARKLQ